MDAGVITAVTIYGVIGVLLALGTAYLLRKRKGMLSGVQLAAIWSAVAGYFWWDVIGIAILSSVQSIDTAIGVIVVAGLIAVPRAYLWYTQSQHLSSAIMYTIGMAGFGAVGYPIYCLLNLYHIWRIKPAPKLSAPERAEGEVRKEELEKEL